jgi:sugar/nucleoside kinase (ribokinase family)
VRGASDHFDVPASDYDRVLAAPIVHLGGTGLLRRLDGEPSRVLLAEAKKRGRTVTFDLIAADAGTIALVRPLLPFIDYFMPSIEEAEIMSGKKDAADAASYFIDHGVSCCVFTLGARGAYYAHRDGTRFSMPAYKLDVVDTTGCGDAFDAGMITALHHGMDPETSVRFAQAAAGLVATGLGSDAGIRSFEHTRERMEAWSAGRA